MYADSRARAGDFGSERQGVASYVTALREHWLLVLTLVALAVGLATAYSLTAKKRYEAEADLVVTPISSNDTTFTGITGPLREQGQERAALTAARFVKSPETADAVARDIGGSRGGLLGSIEVTPRGQSNIVTILGKSSSPRRAAEVANAFAAQTVAQRSALFQGQLRRVIGSLKAQLRTIPPDQRPYTAPGLSQRLADLSTLVGQSDPTLQVSSTAVAPSSPVWPRPVLTIAIALFSSLLLGLGLAVALELGTPRVNREDELLLVQRLPILARVPKMPRRVVRAYLTGREPLPASVREAYRTLRARLTATGGREAFPETILITSAMPGEGKTMTSVNLAIGLAAAPETRVILVDADLRRPMVSTLFGVAAGRHRGLADVLSGEATLDEALVTAPGHGDRLRLLLASPEHAHLVDLLDPDRVARVVSELRLAADVVVFDSPPLTEVADALTIADEVEALIIAVRLGRTRRERLNELRRILAQRGVAPSGFVVTTRKVARGHGYYYGTAESRDGAPPRPAPAEEPRRRRDRSRTERSRRRRPALIPGESGESDDF